MKYCENCKEFLKEKDNYCPLCGRKLVEVKGKQKTNDKSDVLLENFDYENDFNYW